VTRDALAAAAGRSFARSGYQSATTATIAAEAGVSEATLFKHYRTKQALLIAALERARASVRASVAAAAREGGPEPLGSFERLAVALLLDPAFAEITRLRAFALAQADEPEIVAALRRARSELRETLATYFAGWQAKGLVRADVSPEHIADLALGLTFVAAWDLAIDPDEAHEQIRTLVADTIILLRPASQEGSPDA
jgi:AcrR family transcriptional regulator